MGLKPGEEMHHDVQASQSRDPITLEKVFTISQVSDQVLRIAIDQLLDPSSIKERVMNHLLLVEFEISCLIHTVYLPDRCDRGSRGPL